MTTQDSKKSNPALKIIKPLASLKIAVVCHILLIIIVFWGTWAQKDNGLYAAKNEFFTSWYFLIFGFIPFPGGATILSVFSINLIAVFFVRLKWCWRNSGLLLTHVGLILLCAGSAWVYYQTRESYLTLEEDERSSYADDSALWELALWPVEPGTRRVTAISTEDLNHGEVLQFASHGCTATVLVYYEDSLAFGDGPVGVDLPINSQGVKRIQSKPRKEEQAFPGGIFKVKNSQGEAKILLYAGVEGPTTFTLGSTEWQMQLQPQRHQLPAQFELIDVERTLYEGTDIPESFSSHLRIFEQGGIVREARISMNKPLQYNGFTFFQSGYRRLPNGGELTTLAVVENPARLFPYITCIMISLGILVHFITQLFVRRNR